MTSKVHIAHDRAMNAMGRYAELRLQLVKEEQLFVDEMFIALIRVEDVAERYENRLNTLAATTRRAGKEEENDTDIS